MIKSAAFQRRLLPAVGAWWTQPAIRYPLLVFIATRLLTLAIGLSSNLPGPPPSPYIHDAIFHAGLPETPPSPLAEALIEPWRRWDTGWLLKITAQGYAADGSIVFAPLYPALIAALNTVLDDWLLSALVVSSVACLVYLLLFYHLALRELGEATAARYALLAAAGFPTAFYLLAGYTESTFLAFTAGSFAAAFAARWWPAALLAVCATLTRAQGWVLFFPLGWLALTQSPGLWPLPAAGERLTWLRRAAPRLAATGAGPLAVAGLYGYFWLAGFGSISDAYEQLWDMWIRAPWSAVIDVLGRVANGSAQFPEYGGLLALLFIACLLLLSIRRLSPVYHFYLWPTLILILLRYYPLYLLNGTMRYALDFFPLFFTLGALFARSPRLRLWWLPVSTLLQAALLFLFTRWVWIS